MEYELTHAQKRILYADDLYQNSSISNIGGICYVPGKVNFGVLRESINECIRRNEIFRFKFKNKNGQVYQEFVDYKNDEIEFIDFANNRNKFDNWCQQFFDKSIFLYNDDLYKFVIFKLDEKKSGYILKIHHIISDGYSLSVIGNQIAEIYDNLLKIRETDIITTPYSEFIKSESEYLQSEKFLKDKEFWNKEFSDINEKFLYKETYSCIGNNFKYKIPVEITNKLNKLLDENNTAKSTFFMALLYLYLYKKTGDKDIVIGMPVYNRINKRMRSAIGMFVSTVPIRFKINNKITFKDFLKELSVKLRSYYKHQTYPYNVLINDLKLPQKGFDGLFKIMFNYYNGSFRYPMNHEEVEIEKISVKDVTVPLNLVLNEFLESNLELEFEYRINEFDKEEIKVMCNCINNMLIQLVDNFDILVKDIEMISSYEKERILNKFNSKKCIKNIEQYSVCDFFEKMVEKYPDNLAVVHNGESLSYKSLNDKANFLAKLLKDKGIKEKSIVGIITEKSLKSIIGLLAILKAGGTYLPIDIDYPQERIIYMLDDSNAELLLSNKNFRLDYDIERLEITNEELYLENPIKVDSNGNSIAYIMYTSGSTGKPKGVKIPNKGIVRLVIEPNYIELKPGDKMAQSGAMVFDAATFEIWGALLNGMTLFILDKQVVLDPSKLKRTFEENKINICWITSPLFSQLCEADPEIFNELDYLITGGDVVSPKYVVKLQNVNKNINIICAYGPTENTTFTTCFNIPKGWNENENIPIGEAISGTKVYILDSDNNLQPIGIEGELYAAGKGIAEGYVNNLELTQKSFVDNPFDSIDDKMYRTGDLAKFMPDGKAHFLGRIDNQVKLRGFRIEIGEIENQFLKIEDIKEAVVITKKDKNENVYLCAYITTERELDVSSIKEELAKELPNYMVPNYIMRIDKFPLTLNGKVDKKALPEVDMSQMSQTEYEAPKNETERILVEVWKAVLEIERIGINDNYYELGGDSIKSIQIVSRLHNYGIKLEIRDIMEYQTIEELSKHVKYSSIKADQGVVEGEVDYSPIQKWFFDNKFAAENHFNQAFMFDKNDGIDEQILKKAFIEIMKHHDVLRMIYIKEDNKIKQVNRNIENIENMFTLNVYNLESSEDYKTEIENLTNKIQEGMDLENGILLKLGLFKTSKGDHLLIAIHHMIIDGVSWRILLEDLENAYQSVESGKAVVLPEKTTSYKVWVEKLNEYANSKGMLREKEYWNSLTNIEVNEIPKDFKKCESTVEDSKNIIINLSKDETERLLRGTSTAYNTEINDILLCSLGLSIKEWSKNEKILIGLEGHGREEIIGDVSINRTLGWFTSAYPVILDMKNSNDIGYSIKNTKETLRHIPNKGVGYGILKYLTNPENKKNVCFKLNPEIGFNYLGEFSENNNERLFKYSNLSSGEFNSKQNKTLKTIDINCLVIGGELKCIFNYSIKEYKDETIEKLTKLYIKNLLEIIEHCESKKEIEKTPWDYADKELSIEDLNKILSCEKEIEKIHSLTPMQEGMLHYSRINKDSHVYFEQSVFTITGSIDIERVNKVFNKIIEKYEILRTAFFYEDIGKPKQAVLKKRELKIYYEDISNLEENKEEYLEKFKKRDKDKGFDLTDDCLIRLSIIRTDINIYKIVYSFHHIIMDGWCIGIIMKNVIDVYKLLSKNKEIELDKTEPYSKYLDWLDKQDKALGLSYWRNYLSSYEQEINIPKFSDVNASEEFENKEEVFKIDEDLTYKLKSMAEKRSITLNSVMQAAWGVVLQKYNNTNDVVFGSVVSGRPSEINGIENMVGLFINAVPMRVNCEDNTEFIELARKINKDFIEANSYSYCSLAEIQASTSMKNNLINNVVVYENYPIDKKKISSNLDGKSGIKIGDDFEIFEQINYDIGLVIFPGSTITLNIKYNGNIYNKKVIRQIMINLYNELNCVAGNPNVLIRDIDILSVEEKKILLSKFNNMENESPKEKTIKELFEEQVDKTPDNIAVFYDGLNITYKELNERANSLACKLLELGIGDNEIVAIMMNKSIEMIVSIIAVLKSGCAYMPIDPEYPLSRKKYMLKDSNTRILLTRESFLHEIHYYDGMILDVDDNLNYVKTNLNISLGKSNEDLLYIIYTSGTTGNPKGIMFKNKGLVNLIEHEYENTNIKFNNVLQFATICFDVASQEIFSCLLSGGRLCIIDDYSKKDVNKLSNFIVENKIETIFLPTAYFEFLSTNTDFIGSILEVVKDIIVAGEALKISSKMAEKLKGGNICLHNHYGPSETHVITTYTIKADEMNECVPPIGKPIENTNIYILDNNRNLVPIGVEGTLYTSGECLSKGYLNKQDLTNEKFISNPFKKNELMYNTGDLARWLPDGNIECLGRIDNQVKLRGFRIEIGEIENQLSKLKEVKEAVVVAKNNGNGDKYLCGYITAEDEIAATSIKEELSKELPSYMIPSYIVKMDKLPLTANGKIDKRALPEVDISQISEEGYEAPRNEIEEKLVNIWKDVLDIERVGINDNFYDLGGHSLKVTLLNSKIKEKLQVDIPFNIVLTKLTIKELSKYIEKGEYNCKDYVVFNEYAKKNIICFPPSLGYGFVFSRLSERIKDYKMYCYNFVDSDNIIEDYIKRILSVSNEKKFVFIGYSAGGKLAVEIADKMNKMGYSVTDIILIDSMPLNFKLEYGDGSNRILKEEVLQIVSQNMPEYMKFIDNGTYENMARYLKYYNLSSSVKDIASKLHLILMPDEYREVNGINNEKIYNMWKNFAKEVVMHNGIGKHEYMLAKDNVDENANIIFSIIDKIKF